MKKIVTFGNCQADGLARFLRYGLPESRYSVEFYSNNARTGNMKRTNAILRAIRDADIVVFQPLSDRHEGLSAASVLDAARGTTVSFAYLFNSGITALVHVITAGRRFYGTVIGEDLVLKLLEQGWDPEDIIAAFKRGELDFDLPARFRACMRELRRREQRTDVALADHIEESFRSRRQFLTHNHPSTDLFVEVCDQIATRTALPLRIRALRRLENENFARLPARNRCPLSPYDVEALGYEFGPDPRWERHYDGLIRRIAAAHRADREAATRDA